MKPTLSIITVNFNNKEGLIKTLKSIQSQSYTEYEHIIIDAGSTDGSKEVITEYEKNTSKLHIGFRPYLPIGTLRNRLRQHQMSL